MLHPSACMTRKCTTTTGRGVRRWPSSYSLLHSNTVPSNVFKTIPHGRYAVRLLLKKNKPRVWVMTDLVYLNELSIDTHYAALPPPEHLPLLGGRLQDLSSTDQAHSYCVYFYMCVNSYQFSRNQVLLPPI